MDSRRWRDGRGDAARASGPARLRSWKLTRIGALFGGVPEFHPLQSEGAVLCRPFQFGPQDYSMMSFRAALYSPERYLRI
jgi:hypothetical protein